MLENHLLNDLDEDLLLELDKVVRANQLNCLPFAKSGRAESELHELYPTLNEDITEERQRRVRDMSFHANLKDEDSRLSTSNRARVGSLDDLMSATPNSERSHRKSKAARNAPFSPSIRAKDATVDLMFDMDDDEHMSIASPKSPLQQPVFDRSPREKASPKPNWDEGGPQSIPDDLLSLAPRTPSLSIRNGPSEPNSSSKIWSSPMASSKLDMREIMAQASSTRTSALSISISAQNAMEDKEKGKAPASSSALAAAAKLSQKERKKQQQQQHALQQSTSSPKISLDKADGKPASPWQVANRGPITSLKDMLKEEPLPSPSPMSLSADVKSPTSRRTASPDTRFSGQSRPPRNSKRPSPSPSSSSLTPNMTPKSTPTLASSSHQAAPNSSPLVPHSKSYRQSRAEPSLQLSMADIIDLQAREQEVIKEAVKPRDLKDIQEEQAFQEWWDLESRRAQEEELSRTRNGERIGEGSGKNGDGGKASGGRGKGGRGRGGRKRGGGDRGRGRGGGEASAAKV